MNVRFAVSITALALAAFAPATVLTFNIAGSTAGMLMPQAYGDSVTATTMGGYSYGMGLGWTPDVGVDYGPHDLHFYDTGYSDLLNVVENENDGENGYDIIFTPIPSVTLTIDSFDLGNWGGAVTLPGITVRTNSGILWQQTNISVAGNTSPHLTFSPNVSANERIYLHVDTTGMGGNSDNMGLDNIAFHQSAVPEPATMAALGLGIAAMIRRRKR